jgi:hypothetical protein
MVAFVSDEDDPSGEAFRTQCLGCFRTGESSADDDERPVCVDHLAPPR